MSVKFNVVKSLEGHSSDVNNILYFEGRRIIVSSFDNCINVIDVASGKCEKMFENHKGKVNHTIRFNEDVFLSCSDDNGIVGYSLDTMKILKKFELNDCPVFSLMKLRDEADCFLSINEKNEFKIVSFSQNKVVRKLGSYKVNSTSILTHSINMKNSFYFNSSKEDRNKIRSINYNDNKLVKLYRKHRCEINSMAIFLNSLQEEMFVAAGNDSFLYIYNTTYPKFSNNLVKRLQLLNKASSILCYGKGYVPGCRLYGITGTVKGSIELFDFCSTKESKYRKIGEFEAHQKNKKVTCLCFVKFLNPKKRLTIASGSQDRRAKMVTIDGIMNVDDRGEEKNKVKEEKKPLFLTPVSQLKQAAKKEDKRKSVINMMDESDDEEHEGEEGEEDGDGGGGDNKSNEKKKGIMMDDDENEEEEEGEEEEGPGKDTKKIDMMGDDEQEEMGESKEEKERKIMIELEEHLLEKEMMLEVLSQRVKDKDKIISELVEKLTKVRNVLLEDKILQ